MTPADLEALLAAMTPGPVEAVELRLDSQDEMIEYVETCIRSGCDAFFAVLAIENGETVDVCHTGNGPTSGANSVAIAALRNLGPKLVRLWKESANMRRQWENEFGPCDPGCVCDHSRHVAALAALEEA